MKNKTRSNFYLPMAAMILTVALAAPAAAQKLVPLQGALQGQDTDLPGPSPGTLVVATSGTGIASHFGQLTFTQEVTLDLAALTATGFAHWIAANGDSIYTTLTGSGEPTDTPGVFRITETNTIYAGTGRFSGAQGSFTVDRLASAVTFTTFGSFHGSITSPGASR